MLYEASFGTLINILAQEGQWHCTAVQRDNGKLRAVNKPLKTECENQRASLVAYKEGLIRFSGRTENAQTQGVILSVELERQLNMQPRQLCYTKVKALVGKIWIPDIF